MQTLLSQIWQSVYLTEHKTQELVLGRSTYLFKQLQKPVESKKKPAKQNSWAIQKPVSSLHLVQFLQTIQLFAVEEKYWSC
jgi:hypothetical protein